MGFREDYEAMMSLPAGRTNRPGNRPRSAFLGTDVITGGIVVDPKGPAAAFFRDDWEDEPEAVLTTARGYARPVLT